MKDYKDGIYEFTPDEFMTLKEKLLDYWQAQDGGMSIIDIIDTFLSHLTNHDKATICIILGLLREAMNENNSLLSREDLLGEDLLEVRTLVNDELKQLKIMMDFFSSFIETKH